MAWLIQDPQGRQWTSCKQAAQAHGIPHVETLRSWCERRHRGWRVVSYSVQRATKIKPTRTPAEVQPQCQDDMREQILVLQRSQEALLELLQELQAQVAGQPPKCEHAQRYPQGWQFELPGMTLQ